MLNQVQSNLIALIQTQVNLLEFIWVCLEFTRNPKPDIFERFQVIFLVP